ncbi:MAG TPA: 6,7-dimethyl-8-ribityllumazine synthase [Fibrobacteraceae bacterium]|nr:6,7-dimethyl-8-ribityllumazine synthase [Fibrobacteraceae bacterium]
MSFQPTLISGDQQGHGLHIGITVARFNATITEALLQGALTVLERNGVLATHVTVARVPGAFELPLAAQHLIKTHDAVICLGAVIRGGTPHFEYVCTAATQGILRVGLDSGRPVIFGVLTCDTAAQALERSGLPENFNFSSIPDHLSPPCSLERNKGAEAALAALEMTRLCRSF